MRTLRRDMVGHSSGGGLVLEKVDLKRKLEKGTFKTLAPDLREKAMLGDAGFSDVTVAELASDPSNYYYLARKAAAS